MEKRRHHLHGTEEDGGGGLLLQPCDTDSNGPRFLAQCAVCAETRLARRGEEAHGRAVFLASPVLSENKGRSLPLLTPVSPRRSHPTPAERHLYNCYQNKEVRSGDVITLVTENPETHPLPSFELLEMQWILHRVAAISGAVDDYKDDGFNDDGGGDGDGL